MDWLLGKIYIYKNTHSSPTPASQSQIKGDTYHPVHKVRYPKGPSSHAPSLGPWIPFPNPTIFPKIHGADIGTSPILRHFPFSPPPIRHGFSPRQEKTPRYVFSSTFMIAFIPLRWLKINPVQLPPFKYLRGAK